MFSWVAKFYAWLTKPTFVKPADDEVVTLCVMTTARQAADLCIRLNDEGIGASTPAEPNRLGPIPS